MPSREPDKIKSCGFHCVIENFVDFPFPITDSMKLSRTEGKTC